MSSFFRTIFSSKVTKSLSINYTCSWLHKANWLSEGTTFTASNRLFSSEKLNRNGGSKIHRLQESYIPFDEMVASRRAEAKRSILVQVQSESSVNELCSYCGQFGAIRTIYHYSINQAHFILVEFTDEASVNAVIGHGSHLEKEQVVPIRSPLLWFRAGSKKEKKLLDPSIAPVLYSSEKLQLPQKSEFDRLLMEADSISDQIMKLYQHSKLNDIGCRLRFLTARQVELMLSGVFPCIRVLPFGSSVNSYGKIGCDLDLCVLLDEIKEREGVRLIFQAKTSLTNDRAQIQRQMEAFADLMQLLLPGCSHVRRILHARVPIIKYNQDLTFVECDLSMTNLTAIYMSELLYIMGFIDWRVRPLVFSVRWWAQEIMLTNLANPGRWISNFSLTLLVIFFLQRVKILPSLDSLVTAAGPEDVRLSDDGVNCTFLRDLSKLTVPSNNSSSLEELLITFFEYYANFDFSSKAISINSANIISKPEYSSMYIVNPLEKSLNVSKNVSLEETERLKIEARNAAWFMDANSSIGEENKSITKPWGLLELVKDVGPAAKSKSQNVFTHYLRRPLKNDSRLVSVEDLFNDTNEEDDRRLEAETGERVARLDKSKQIEPKQSNNKNNKSILAKRR